MCVGAAAGGLPLPFINGSRSWHMTSTRMLHKIHRWTGLVAGINILILSLTGAYLVFTEEIAALFPITQGQPVFTQSLTSTLPVQGAIDALKERHPGSRPLRVRRAENMPGNLELLLAQGKTLYRYNMSTVDGSVRIAQENAASKFTRFMFDLHATLFLGFWGSFALGAVALAFLASTVSGILIYGRFMKQRLFGELRFDKGVRRASSDVHKLVGAASLGFNLLMALTGIALTIGLICAQFWSINTVKARTGGRPDPAQQVQPPIDAVLAAARATHPTIPVDNIAYPGGFQGKHFYLCYHFDDGALTRHIPALTLVPVEAPEKAEALAIPWWIKATMVCFPLHFGNFAGLPLKIVYSLLGISSGALTLTGTLLTFNAWGKKLKPRRRLTSGALMPVTELSGESEA